FRGAPKPDLTVAPAVGVAGRPEPNIEQRLCPIGKAHGGITVRRHHRIHFPFPLQNVIAYRPARRDGRATPTDRARPRVSAPVCAAERTDGTSAGSGPARRVPVFRGRTSVRAVG